LPPRRRGHAAGKDRITSADGTKKTASCGAGPDFVRTDPADRVRGCERVLRRKQQKRSRATRRRPCAAAA
jgi:hypothetical protein